MQETIKTFRYTAQRTSYLNIISAFTFLLIVEGGITELLFELLIPVNWIKLMLLIISIVLYCFIFALFLFPLWTKHHLSTTHLHLRYGLMLNVHLPLDAISDVQTVHKSSSRIQPISAYYDVKQRHLVACFSDRGLLHLTLKQPHTLKIGRRQRTITNILFNVDQYDELLASLSEHTVRRDAPTTSQNITTHPPMSTEGCHNSSRLS
jgi:hypothetical protein